MTVTIKSIGLEDVKRYFDQMPDLAEQAAVMTINQVTKESLPTIRRTMRAQIDFPSGYLEGDRLKVKKIARRGTLEAVISGRDRPTSLARFAGGQNVGNTRGRGVRVQVKNGQTRLLKKGFLVNLKNGNTGLAVRLKEGESLRNSERAMRLADNVYLLYGPSVDQVFKGVADDVSPEMGRKLTKGFLKQFAFLSRGFRG